MLPPRRLEYFPPHNRKPGHLIHEAAAGTVVARNGGRVGGATRCTTEYATTPGASPVPGVVARTGPVRSSSLVSGPMASHQGARGTTPQPPTYKGTPATLPPLHARTQTPRPPGGPAAGVPASMSLRCLCAGLGRTRTGRQALHRVGREMAGV